MLRYLKVIQAMKNIIESTGKPVMMTVARYVCSYAKIGSEVWWNKSKSCGPIVEQGTHLVDLCRYFGGPVLLDTVQATSTEVSPRDRLSHLVGWCPYTCSLAALRGGWSPRGHPHRRVEDPA
jgi:predicted dehydrogenase